MNRTVCIKTEDTDIGTETQSLVISAASRISDHEVDSSYSVSITSEEVARRTKAVTYTQLALLCDLMRELKNDQFSRRHEKTASFKAAGSSSAVAAGLTLF